MVEQLVYTQTTQVRFLLRAWCYSSMEEHRSSKPIMWVRSPLAPRLISLMVKHLFDKETTQVRFLHELWFRDVMATWTSFKRFFRVRVPTRPLKSKVICLSDKQL